MTAEVSTRLLCAAAGCRSVFGPLVGWPGEVRRKAEDAGWEYEGEDRCPRHPASADEPPPALFDLPEVDPVAAST